MFGFWVFSSPILSGYCNKSGSSSLIFLFDLPALQRLFCKGWLSFAQHPHEVRCCSAFSDCFSGKTLVPVECAYRCIVLASWDKLLLFFASLFLIVKFKWFFASNHRAKFSESILGIDWLHIANGFGFERENFPDNKMVFLWFHIMLAVFSTFYGVFEHLTQIQQLCCYCFVIGVPSLFFSFASGSFN